jgi:hypothetical protein
MFCFIETTHELLPLHKVLYNERSWTNRCGLFESLFSLTGLFNMVMVEILTSEVDEKLHQATWDHQTLYADKSSNAEQPLIIPLLQ